MADSEGVWLHKIRKSLLKIIGMINRIGDLSWSYVKDFNGTLMRLMAIYVDGILLED